MDGHEDDDDDDDDDAAQTRWWSHAQGASGTTGSQVRCRGDVGRRACGEGSTGSTGRCDESAAAAGGRSEGRAGSWPAAAGRPAARLTECSAAWRWLQRAGGAGLAQEVDCVRRQRAGLSDDGSMDGRTEAAGGLKGHPRTTHHAPRTTPGSVRGEHASHAQRPSCSP